MPEGPARRAQAAVDPCRPPPGLNFPAERRVHSIPPSPTTSPGAPAQERASSWPCLNECDLRNPTGTTQRRAAKEPGGQGMEGLQVTCDAMNAAPLPHARRAMQPGRRLLATRIDCRTYRSQGHTAPHRRHPDTCTGPDWLPRPARGNGRMTTYLCRMFGRHNNDTEYTGNAGSQPHELRLARDGAPRLGVGLRPWPVLGTAASCLGLRPFCTTEVGTSRRGLRSPRPCTGGRGGLLASVPDC